ncbi:MAG: outer membrane protein assembly factor BamB [Rickettsiales bacterium]|jgi:outer membrane protein assembly factor BamB
MKIFAAILISIIFTTSCSSDNKIDDKNAVLVFAKNDFIKADSDLSDLKISVPKQINSESWFGNNSDNNQKIENFAFTPKNSKKILSKIKSINTGWKLGYKDRMIFSPIIANDKIYTLNAKGVLFAKNISNYKTIWKKKLVKRSSIKYFTNGKISYFDDKIFVSTGYNLVLCVDANNGKIIWQRTLSSIPISAPISDEKQVFVITNDNKTYALDAKNGQINWVHSGIVKPTGILGSANPVSYKNYVISSYSSGEIYALNKKNGESGWVFDLNISKADNSNFILNDIDSTPIIKNDVVYAIGNGGLMMSIRIVDGVVLWQKELASIADFWIAGDFIYLIDNQNQVICLEKKSGKIKWVNQLREYLSKKKSKGKIIYNGIIMVGGNLILTNFDEKILAVSPFDGKILQTKKLGQKIFHNPIVVNKKVYLHTIGRFSSKLLVIE